MKLKKCKNEEECINKERAELMSRERNLHLKILESDEAAVQEIAKLGLLNLDINVLIETELLNNGKPNHQSLLHSALEFERWRTVELLLQHPGIDVNIQRRKIPRRALHIAASQPNTEILLSLLHRGAKVNDDSCPIMWAVRAGIAENVDILCRAGADLSRHEMFDRTALEFTILDLKSANSRLYMAEQPEIITFFQQRCNANLKIIDILLRNGAGIGSFLPPCVTQLELNLSEHCFFGAYIDHKPVTHESRQFKFAILTLDDLDRHRHSCQENQTLDAIPYPQLLLRLEEIRARLNESNYAPYIPIKRSLEMLAPNKVNLQRLCLEFIARQPVLRSRCLLPTATTAQLKKLLSQIPENEDIRLDVRKKGVYYQEKINILNDLERMASSNITARINNKFKIPMLVLAFGVVSLIMMILITGFMTRTWFAIINPDSSVTKINCWDVVPLFSNNPYKENRSYPGCGGLFTGFIVCGILLLLSVISLLFLRYWNRVDRSVFKQLENFQRLAIAEGAEQRKSISIDITHHQIPNVLKSIHSLKKQYKICLRELNEIHPSDYNPYPFFQPCPQEPGQNRNIENVVIDIDEIDTNEWSDESIPLLNLNGD